MMHIRSSDDKYILLFYNDPKIVYNKSDKCTEIELKNKKELLELRARIDEILRKEKSG